jgi:oxygen-independent coproporphyrinogen III oxidase
MIDVPKWERIRKPWRRWDEAALRRNIGVYLHIPFCLHRCTYCDFLTYGDKRPQGLTPPAYVDALLDEIKQRGEWAWREYGDHGRYVDTVFFGGGTPTYLEADVLAKLVRTVYENFPIARVAPATNVRAELASARSDEEIANGPLNIAGGDQLPPYDVSDPSVEFTTEANPDTLTPDYLACIAEAGVNRISIGVQATQTRHLRLMQRTHRWRDIEPRLAWLPGGPIPRYSFDLIYGLPGMTVTDVKTSARRLLQFKPRHVSAYELIYEPGTPLHRWLQRYKSQELPEADRLAQHRALGRLLGDHGLYRYEISNYALPGEESRHNLRYWRGGDYIGLGIGAASRFGTEVVNNPRNFEKYRESFGGAGIPARGHWRPGMAAPPFSPPADIFLRMRTRLGMEQNGHHPDSAWLTNGWVRKHNGQLEVTDSGLSFADLYHKQLS